MNREFKTARGRVMRFKILFRHSVGGTEGGKSISEDGRSLNQDSNLGLPKYETEVLISTPTLLL
jgi:hypothetical protein